MSLKASFGNGRITIEWYTEDTPGRPQTGQILITNGSRKSWVTDEGLEDVFLNILREYIAIRDKFSALIEASNKATREAVNSAKVATKMQDFESVASDKLLEDILGLSDDGCPKCGQHGMHVCKEKQ